MRKEEKERFVRAQELRTKQIYWNEKVECLLGLEGITKEKTVILPGHPEEIHQAFRLYPDKIELKKALDKRKIIVVPNSLNMLATLANKHNAYLAVEHVEHTPSGIHWVYIHGVAIA